MTSVAIDFPLNFPYTLEWVTISITVNSASAVVAAPIHAITGKPSHRATSS